jgi:hypothetical protein
MTWKALCFLVHRWEEVTSYLGGAEAFLLDYVQEHPGVQADSCVGQ